MIIVRTIIIVVAIIAMVIIMIKVMTVIAAVNCDRVYKDEEIIDC
jgi:hypothetical protein